MKDLNRVPPLRCDIPAENREDINHFICEAHLSVTTKYSPDFEAK